MNDVEVFDAALKEWGVAAQLGILQEECAELIVAGSHVLRGRSELRDGFMEELVDVKIMCEQFIHYFIKNGCGGEFYAIYRRKMERLQERLKINPPSVEGVGLPDKATRG